MWYKDRQTLVGKDINHSHDFLLHLLLQNMMPRFFWKNCIWFLKCLLENMIIFMWKIWYFTLFLPIMIRNKLKVWNFYTLVEIYISKQRNTNHRQNCAMKYYLLLKQSPNHLSFEATSYHDFLGVWNESTSVTRPSHHQLERQFLKSMIIDIEDQNSSTCVKTSNKQNLLLWSYFNSSSKFKASSRDFSLSHNPFRGIFWKIFISFFWMLTSKDESSRLCCDWGMVNSFLIQSAMHLPNTVLQMQTLSLMDLSLWKMLIHKLKN